MIALKFVYLCRRFS